MNFNMNQIAQLQKIRECISRFRTSHPKFPLFVKAVSQNALVPDTIVEIKVTTPDGQDYTSNLKLNEGDMELIELLKTLN